MTSGSWFNKALVIEGEGLTRELHTGTKERSVFVSLQELRESSKDKDRSVLINKDKCKRRMIPERV